MVNEWTHFFSDRTVSTVRRRIRLPRFLQEWIVLSIDVHKSFLGLSVNRFPLRQFGEVYNERPEPELSAIHYDTNPNTGKEEVTFKTENLPYQSTMVVIWASFVLLFFFRACCL